MPGRVSGSVRILLPNMYYGLDADKSTSPSTGDIYVATDTNRVYVCFTAGFWSHPYREMVYDEDYETYLIQE